MFQQSLGYSVRPCLTKTKGRAGDVAQLVEHLHKALGLTFSTV